MKKTFVVLMVLCACLFLTVFGCKKDDPPTTPPVEDCSLAISMPAAASLFYTTIDNGVNIRWTETGSATEVKVELLKDGNIVGTIDEVTENDNFHYWLASTMGAGSGDTFAIRITAVGETDCSATSGEFSIVNMDNCSFAVETPMVGGLPEPLQAGTQETIRWTSESTSGTVVIELMKRDESLGIIAADIDDDQEYIWDVHTFHEGSYFRYAYRVSDAVNPACYATSGYFSINDTTACAIMVQSPFQEAQWTEGETRRITYTTDNMVGNQINIYLESAGERVTTIATNVLVSEYGYDWVVSLNGETTIYNSFKVVIESADDHYCIGESGVFRIDSAY